MLRSKGGQLNSCAAIVLASGTKLGVWMELTGKSSVESNLVHMSSSPSLALIPVGACEAHTTPLYFCFLSSRTEIIIVPPRIRMNIARGNMWKVLRTIHYS